MLIYVAGPLSGKDGQIGRLSNVISAVEIGERLYELGHMAYIPHLSVFQHKILRRLNPTYRPTYERWLAYDFEIIRRCDALYYFGSSPGADKERAFAESIGKPIFTSMQEVSNGNNN